MSWRLAPSILLAAFAVASPSSIAATTASASSKIPCGFGAPEDRASHMITFRKNVSCNDARQILRRLRGSQGLIPMACTQVHYIDGWRLKNIWLQLPDMETKFTRGNIEIHYLRVSNGHPSCKQDNLTYDEPDA